MKPGLRMSPCALTSPMMANRVTGLLKHLWHLLVLSTKSSSDIADEEIALRRMRLQELLSHKNPLTELRRASSVALLGRKVLAVPATSAAPECMFFSLVILWPKLGPDYPAIILRNSCTYTRFGQKSGSGRSSLGVVSTGRPHARTQTQTHKRIHKKPSGSYSLLLRWDKQ